MDPGPEGIPTSNQNQLKQGVPCHNLHGKCSSSDDAGVLNNVKCEKPSIDGGVHFQGFEVHATDQPGFQSKALSPAASVDLASHRLAPRPAAAVPIVELPVVYPSQPAGSASAFVTSSKGAITFKILTRWDDIAIEPSDIPPFSSPPTTWHRCRIEPGNNPLSFKCSSDMPVIKEAHLGTWCFQVDITPEFVPFPIGHD